MYTAMKRLLAFPLKVLIAIPPWLLLGVVVHDLWNWFITPMGFPRMAIVTALGASLIWSTLSISAFLMIHRKVRDPEVDGTLFDVASSSFGVSIVYLFIWLEGYVLLQFR